MGGKQFKCKGAASSCRSEDRLFKFRFFSISGVNVPVYEDSLTAMLFAVGFSGLTILYLARRMLARKGKGAGTDLESCAPVLGLLGLYTFVNGLYCQLTWPLPGSYNILYYDILPLWGLLLMGLGVAFYRKMKLRYIGFLSALVGLMAIGYGVANYSIGPSPGSTAVLALYSLFGLAGVLGYGITLMADGDWRGGKTLWAAVWTVFALALLIGSLLAILIGAGAVPAHLLSAP
jgi:putative membrane protein